MPDTRKFVSAVSRQSVRLGHHSPRVPLVLVRRQPGHIFVKLGQNERLELNRDGSLGYGFQALDYLLLHSPAVARYPVERLLQVARFSEVLGSLE